MKNTFSDAGAVFGLVVAAIAILIFGGAITFGLGYLGGIFLKWVCGGAVADGLNMVLGNFTQYNFTANDVPLFVAIMTTIGGFFKNSISTKSKD